MAVPKKLGRYRILREVGKGGLGQVFMAIDEKTARTVAVKILHGKFQRNVKRLGYFHRELLIASRLKNKHIVEFIDANFEPPVCYIVTEFVDGWSLHGLLKRVSPLPPLVALSIAIDMLQGIDYLHLHDMIHSDLSSPNVMIDKSGRVLVTDFGLATQDQVEDYKKYVVGTPGYYSPEHVTESAIVPKSDVYCVGLLLYEMLTGKKAVEGSRQRKVIYEKMKKIDFGLVRASDRKLQRALRKILKVSLRVKPHRRMDSAETMLFEIYKILRTFDIRYARYAIGQFLYEEKLIEDFDTSKTQKIRYGFFKP